MIIYRQQRDFSIPATRAIAGVKRAIGGKSKVRAAREAINVQNKALPVVAKLTGKIKSGKSIANLAATNPGQAVSMGTGKLIQNPVAVTSNIAGNTATVLDPLGVGLIPIGAIGTAGEVALKKKLPRYAKVTDRLAGKYNKSKFSKLVEGGVNGMVTSLKSFG